MTSEKKITNKLVDNTDGSSCEEKEKLIFSNMWSRCCSTQNLSSGVRKANNSKQARRMDNFSGSDKCNKYTGLNNVVPDKCRNVVGEKNKFNIMGTLNSQRTDNG